MSPVSDPLTLLASARRILCDIDGCLVRGATAIPGAADFVRAYADRLALVSNNSTDTPHSMAHRLGAMGLAVAPERIHLAGENLLVGLSRKLPGARILLVGTPAIRQRARDLGLVLEGTPDLIVLCRAPAARVSLMETVLEHALAGIPVLAANPDITHPGANGPAIETGALAGLLQTCLPHIRATILGKPDAGLFTAALDGIPPAEAVMIGDNPQTDRQGAERLRIPFLMAQPDREHGPTIADFVPAPHRLSISAEVK